MAYDSTNTGAEVDAAIAKVAARSGDLIDGSGNATKITKFSGANTITDSIITDSGSAVTVAGAVVANTFSVADGTASLPSITNTGDTNTGIYFPTENSIAFTAGAGATLTSTNTALTVAVPTTVESTAQASLTLQGGDTNSKNLIFKKASAQQGKITAVGNELKFYAGTSGTESLEITTTGVVIPGDLTVDTTTLKVDSTNNRVGIGATSPSEKLHVKSSNSDTAETVAGFGNGDIDVGLQIKTNGNGGSSLDWGFNAVNSRNLVFDTNQTERMRIDSSGNVGIGTSPSHKLDVNGDFRATGALRDSSGDAGTSGQILSSTGTGTNWINNTGGSSQWVTTGSDIYYNTGNVGINDSTPSYKLDVNGTGRFVNDLTLDEELIHNLGGDGAFPGYSADGTSSHGTRGCVIEDGGVNGSTIYVARRNQWALHLASDTGSQGSPATVVRFADMDEQGEDEAQKISIVSFANAVVDKWAVMVEYQYAVITSPIELRS